MGRIADAVASGEHAVDDWRFTNKVDTILELLDDDDRAIVLGWLLAPDIGCESVEKLLRHHQIRCSDSTIRRWRDAQADGTGVEWAA